MNAMSPASVSAAGFHDPVQQSQQAFRVLLDALASPGRVSTMPSESGHPTGLSPALAAALLTLCDYDTPVWLGPGFGGGDIATWLRFHTGAPVVQAADAAAFVLLHGDHLLPLDSLDWGSDAAPDKGATLLLQVQALSGAGAIQWQGPGLKQPIGMPDFGLGRDFWEQRLQMGDAFPRGLDIFFGAGNALAALPRSTRLRFQGA